jgi:hypothetical protein
MGDGLWAPPERLGQRCPERDGFVFALLRAT